MIFILLFKELDEICDQTAPVSSKSVQPFGHNIDLKFLLSKSKAMVLTRLQTLYFTKNLINFVQEISFWRFHERSN